MASEARIPGREVVRGDLVMLNEGDRVPANATLISCHTLEADELLFYGEAVPVRKALSAGLPSDARPGGDDLPFVYSGSLIVRGQGFAEVTATGARSEIGKIGKSLSVIEGEPPPIQHGNTAPGAPVCDRRRIHQPSFHRALRLDLFGLA